VDSLLAREVRTNEEADALIRLAWTAKRPDGADMVGVLDAVPVLSPQLERPSHLSVMSDVFHRAERAAAGDGKPVLALLSAPPQIGKTLTGQHAFAWWLARNPTHFLAFLAYGQDLASEKSKGIRALTKTAGVQLRDDTKAADLWRTVEGGGLLARGLEAGITGQSGIVMAWVDDPYKGRSQVESAKERRTVIDGIRSNVFSRLGPRTSLLISHTRWHSDDAIGVLSREHADRFEVHQLPACTDDGEPLITLGGRDRAFYEQQRALSEHDWWSLYMGQPRARDGKHFKESTIYTVTPTEMQIAIGVDFAYSRRTSADWSTAVVLGRLGERRYVLAVVRRQCTASEFAGELRTLKQRWPTAGMHAYIGGQEGGIVDLLRTQGVYINAKHAATDKFTRSLTTAAAWNRGEILVPEQAPWLSAFVGEVADFSGINDDHDDQVDALVAAFDALGIGTVIAFPGQPGPRSAPHLTGGSNDPWAVQLPPRRGWNSGSG
jgi:predicted phage terminase large subunit-like protein